MLKAVKVFRRTPNAAEQFHLFRIGTVTNLVYATLRCAIKFIGRISRVGHPYGRYCFQRVLQMSWEMHAGVLLEQGPKR